MINNQLTPLIFYLVKSQLMHSNTTTNEKQIHNENKLKLLTKLKLKLELNDYYPGQSAYAVNYKGIQLKSKSTITLSINTERRMNANVMDVIICSVCMSLTISFRGV